MATSNAATPAARLLIVGCGYVGRRIAALAQQHHYAVYAMTRSSARRTELEQLGITPIVANWLQPDSIEELPVFDQLLISVPHREAGELGEHTHVSGLRNLLDRPELANAACIYLSTTGVYSAESGEQIDESTPTSPARIGPKIAICAEEFLLSQNQRRNDLVLRLAGIYGPGRIPLAAKLLAGEAISVPQDGYLNLVHVNDIASILMHLFTHRMNHTLYLLSDGFPVRRRDFYQELARLCGAAPPQFGSDERQNGQQRRATNKRINPQRLLEETGVTLQFPTFREGLANAVGTLRHESVQQSNDQDR